MIGWSRAVRLGPATIGTAILLVTGFATASTSVRVTQGAPVRVVWFLLLGMVVVATLPLYPSFGVLEATLFRARQDRVLRAAASAAIIVGGGVAMRLMTAAETAVTWSVLLGAVTVLAAALTTDLAWLVALVLGGGTLMWEHVAVSSPVSAAMDSVGWVGSLAVLVAAGAAYCALPPRSRDEPAV
jgi:hypothetical protein